MSDFTSEDLIAAFKRSYAYHGKKTILFRIKATNFIGTNSEIDCLLNSSGYASRHHEWMSFVVNRTQEILGIIPYKISFYFPSKQNAVGLPSRGVIPEDLSSD
ncbi:hypothetical protein NPIL_479671 [Nephila pilipes]|uniref:Uncharacterized protein n=1 Tax=Nephila pilipes TaxID=299642 RepID=A0A8X6P6H7_NEPPI|nr:hypothetical protein NPIL_479671 [Nephila pilipes]